MIHLQRPTKKSDRARSHLSTPRGRVKLRLEDGITHASTDKSSVAAVLIKRHGFSLVVAAAPAPKPVAPEPAPVAEPSGKGPSKARLKAQAKALEIPGYSKMSKTELAAVVEDAS